MKPNLKKITIDSNQDLIKDFIREIIISPRIALRHWSQITHQTPAIKVGYVGQHLASLVTGVEGTGSGARGDDLADGSEVKSCNKIDQADKCKDCGSRVLRYEEKCSSCGSSNIERKEDSKWLFTIRSVDELQQYLNMDRVVLLLLDYPEFVKSNFNDMRISVFEIYPKDTRMKVFCDLIKNHYYNIFLPKLNHKQKTNPMNLHPFSYQFYLCNPILIFQCTIKGIDTTESPEILIDTYIPPKRERNLELKSVEMPSSLLNDSEWSDLLNNADFNKELKPILRKDISKEAFNRLTSAQKSEYLVYIPECLRKHLILRAIKSVQQKTHYKRR